MKQKYILCFSTLFVFVRQGWGCVERSSDTSRLKPVVESSALWSKIADLLAMEVGILVGMAFGSVDRAGHPPLKTVEETLALIYEEKFTKHWSECIVPAFINNLKLPCCFFNCCSLLLHPFCLQCLSAFKIYLKMPCFYEIPWLWVKHCFQTYYVMINHHLMLDVHNQNSH